MKLQQLQVLIAVVDTGGIRAAARLLNLSQAAVTKSMKSLEDAAATPLLHRKARGVTLTEAGAKLLARAQKVSQTLGLD